MPNLQPFNFEQHNVRVIDKDGEPWFVLADVCDVLDITNATDAAKRLDDDEVTLDSIEGSHRLNNIINESGLYSLVLTSRKPQAKRFKKWVTSEVLPSIRKTGGYKAPSTAATMALVECAANLLRASDSGRVVMLRKAGQAIGADTSFLPDYTEDSAPGHVGAMDTASATHLLREHGVKLSASAFNLRLSDIGLLESKERKTTGGKIKHFWCITDAGLAYGKNVVSPQSPRETQPHWYRSQFDQLLVMVGLGEGGAA